MDKKTNEELKQKLEKQKLAIEEQLKVFAEQDPALKGDWDSRFPRHDGGTGSSALEDAADEVEEYATRLPIEYNLELRLKNINLAIEKIKKGKYGVCEKCGKKIDPGRLGVCPEARFCVKCQ